MSGRLSHLASELQGSEILKIGAEVRAAAAAGRPVTNLTVGDFSAKEFRIPREIEEGIAAALAAGEFTYPPSNGLDVLRSALRKFYADRMGLDFPMESVLVTAGARPAIYSLFRAVVSPGDEVVYGVPSWNNEYYVQIVGARGVPVICDASTNFQPTAKMLAPKLRNARLLSMNSPLNPTGTMIRRESLEAICDLVLEENARRPAGERPLYLMYDQVYWMITAGGVEHVDPVTLRPEIGKFTVIVDAISKAFAATGLRVGWALGPADVIKSMSDISGHVGAWAPRPEQFATAKLLCDAKAVDAYIDGMRSGASARLRVLADGLKAMRGEGLPVDCIEPQGAIYVSAQFALHGKRTPSGVLLTTNDQIRKYLLDEAGLGAVPFQAFGFPGDTGWFRLSIGVVSVAEIEALLPRLKAAIQGAR